LCFILQGINWGDVERKAIRMPYQPAVDSKNDESVHNELSMEVLAHPRVFVSKSTPTF
jgi:hypothetical protein